MTLFQVSMLILPSCSRAKWRPVSNDFSQASTLPNLSEPDWRRPLSSNVALNSVCSVEVMMPPSVARNHRSKFKFFYKLSLIWVRVERTRNRSRQLLITASSNTFPISRSLRCNFFFSVIFLPRAERSLSKQILTQRSLAPQENAFF